MCCRRDWDCRLGLAWVAGSVLLLRCGAPQSLAGARRSHLAAAAAAAGSRPSRAGSVSARAPGGEQILGRRAPSSCQERQSVSARKGLRVARTANSAKGVQTRTLKCRSGGATALPGTLVKRPHLFSSVQVCPCAERVSAACPGDVQAFNADQNDAARASRRKRGTACVVYAAVGCADSKCGSLAAASAFILTRVPTGALLQAMGTTQHAHSQRYSLQTGLHFRRCSVTSLPRQARGHSPTTQLKT